VGLSPKLQIPHFLPHVFLGETLYFPRYLNNQLWKSFLLT
jgi:hypothetical protein